MNLLLINYCHRLALHCNYGTHLDEALQDQFMGGLNSEAMQKHMLSEDTLTFKKAVEIAVPHCPYICPAGRTEKRINKPRAKQPFRNYKFPQPHP